MPHVKAAYEKLHNREFDVVAINLDGKKSAVLRSELSIAGGGARGFVEENELLMARPTDQRYRPVWKERQQFFVSNESHFHSVSRWREGGRARQT